MEKRIMDRLDIDTLKTVSIVVGGIWVALKFVKLFVYFYDIATKPLGQPAYARKREKQESLNTPPPPPRVIIIGGGPAGIATAGALNKEGISNIVLERSNQPASSWRSHYKRLHLHTASNFSSLPYLPYPSHFPLYISREQFADYVAGYASIMQVKINYDETVTNISVGENGKGYTVESVQNGSKINTYQAEAVVVCTGENIVPLIPNFVDQHLFKGTIVHSSKYQTAEEFRGKKVLVVGFGNTGGELSIDLYESGCDVHVLARSPVNIVKRSTLLLVPPIARYLPVCVQLVLEWIFLRLDYGDMAKYGIQCPISRGFKDLGYYRLRNFHEAPIVDIGQIALIRKKLIQVQKYEIERFTPTGVVFKNGKEESYDVVVLATGWSPNLSKLLSGDIYKSTISEKGFPLGYETVQKNQPGIFYVGFEDEAGRILRITETAIRAAGSIKKQLLSKK